MNNSTLWFTKAFASCSCFFRLILQGGKDKCAPFLEGTKHVVVRSRPEILMDGFVVAASESGYNLSKRDSFNTVLQRCHDLLFF